MKHLVVFDLDGTLAATREPDGELFVRAVYEVIGIKGIDTDWSVYRHATDSGILAEIIEGYKDRPARSQEVRAVQNRFVTLLKAESSTAPSKFREVPGAGRMLSILRQHANFEYAVATGSWRETALIKLRAVGLDIDGLPLATCDDSVRREGIVQSAIEKATAQYNLPNPLKVTSVGDGVWDVQTATRLGLPFIGIASGSQATRLRRAGAEHVIEDFTDLEGFLDLLSR